MHLCTKRYLLLLEILEKLSPPKSNLYFVALFQSSDIFKFQLESEKICLIPQYVPIRLAGALIYSSILVY